jgi:phosphonate transport system permease protein
MHSPWKPKRMLISAFIGLLVVAVYVISIRVTQIDFPRLVRDTPKGQQILKDLLRPDLFTRQKQVTTIELAFPIPCGSASEIPQASSGARLVTDVPCADPKAQFTLQGYELEPNADIAVRWRFPDGRTLTALRAKSDGKGNFSVPLDAKPLAASKDGVASTLQVDTAVSIGGIVPSEAFKDVIAALYVTIFMALLSTSIATVIAAPLSFLAASNITRKGVLGTIVYYFTRSFFNITRSYEPLVLATVFGFWLGFGPFAGAMALTVVTIASLGKLFSEAVENIDSGPIEALQATGANRLQTVIYAVIPQIVPDFLSYIIYHWDINVRISTIIGFVGGGGIGYYLSQRINQLEYSKAGTAILAIVIIVWSLDFLSAQVRKKFV